MKYQPSPSPKKMKFLRFLPNKARQRPFFSLLSTAQSSNLSAAEQPPPPETPASLSSLVERLPRGKSVVLAFQTWMAQGNPVHRGDIFHAVNRLRKLKLNKRALEVMEWVIRERPYKLRTLDYSCLLEFTAMLHGISHGEALFCRIPKEFHDELLYNNLVLACLSKGAIRLSLEYMKKMRELGFPISYLVFNRLIIYHSTPGRRKAIWRIRAQMRADKVTPHPSTFNILLKIEANDHNIEGLVRIFSDMKRTSVEPNEVTYCILATSYAVARLYTACESYVQEVEKSQTGKNWSTLDVLLILYGYLGKECKLEQIWGTIVGLPIVRSKSFVLAIEAFGRIGKLDRAEGLWLEMKTSKKLKQAEQFNAILSAYCRHGLVKKAAEIYKEMIGSGCKPNAITYRNLALGCLKAGLVDETLKALEMGSGEITMSWIRKSTPWLETTFTLLELFADMGDLSNTNRLFEELKESKFCRYTFVYNALLKAHVKAKVHNPDFLKNMILQGARPDSETYSLVRLLDNFKC